MAFVNLALVTHILQKNTPRPRSRRLLPQTAHWQLRYLLSHLTLKDIIFMDTNFS